MTIGAGFICRDGLVLSADTEEYYGAYSEFKSNTQKLYVLKDRAVLVGAGIGALVDHAKYKICSLLAGNILDETELEARLGDLMLILYERTFANYPVDNLSEKRIEFLLGVKLPVGKPLLFAIDSTAVTKITDLRLIGSGQVLKELATEMRSFLVDTTQVQSSEIVNIDMRQGVLAALYLISEAKKRIGGIGGRTNIVTISNDGDIDEERPWGMLEREALFEDARLISRMLLLRSDPSVSNEDFLRTLRNCQHIAREMRRNHLAIEKRYKAKMEGLGEMAAQFLQKKKKAPKG